MKLYNTPMKSHQYSSLIPLLISKSTNFNSALNENISKLSFWINVRNIHFRSLYFNIVTFKVNNYILRNPWFKKNLTTFELENHFKYYVCPFNTKLTMLKNIIKDEVCKNPRSYTKRLLSKSQIGSVVLAFFGIQTKKYVYKCHLDYTRKVKEENFLAACLLSICW